MLHSGVCPENNKVCFSSQETVVLLSKFHKMKYTVIKSIFSFHSFTHPSLPLKTHALKYSSLCFFVHRFCPNSASLQLSTNTRMLCMSFSHRVRVWIKRLPLSSTLFISVSSHPFFLILNVSPRQFVPLSLSFWLSFSYFCLKPILA